MFKKKKKHPTIVNQEQLSVIFGRLVHEALSIKLRFGSDLVRSRVIAEVEGSIFTGFRLEDIEKYKIKTNNVVNIVFYHEGKEYYGGMRVLGAGRYEKQEAIRLKIPTILNIKDDFGLTTFNVNPRIDVTYTNMFKQYCSGQMINLGCDGIDMLNKESAPTKELLAVDRECEVAFDLDDVKVYTKGYVLYINNVGEELIGIEFVGMDSKTKAAIDQWIQTKTAEKAERDKQWLRSYKSGDLPKKGEIPKVQARKGPLLQDEYKIHMHEGDPFVLILSRDTNMLERMGKALKRKYGVMVSKGRFSNVKEILAHYKPAMIMVSDTLGSISGYDLVSTIKEQIEGAPPMVIMGTEDDSVALTKAVSRGALGYWNIDTFRPLSFFKSIEETLAKLQDDGSEGDADSSEPDGEQDATSRDEPIEAS